MNKKLKAILESEKKEFEEKIRIMRNHISAVKKQQEEMNKKIIFLKIKKKILIMQKTEKNYKKGYL